MTRLEQFIAVHTKLVELNTEYLLAQSTKDKRRHDKAIREAKNDIENYSTIIPFEIKVILENQVGANFLNFQHVDDISLCIDTLEKLIKEEKDKE